MSGWLKRRWTEWREPSPCGRDEQARRNVATGHEELEGVWAGLCSAYSRMRISWPHEPPTRMSPRSLPTIM